ncbi:MAG: deoxyribonuclease IV [Planctomycetota bacterium]
MPASRKCAAVPAPAAPAERAARPIGIHLSIAGGVHHALEAAFALRCPTVQIFVKNQRQWRAAPFDPLDVARWHVLRQRPGFGPVVAHATYLINLAAESAALYEQSRAAFTEELLRCRTLAISYLVVHPGSAGELSRNVACARVAETLDRCFERYDAAESGLEPAPVMPLLELTAGQGRALGSRFDELAEIIGRVRDPRRVGVCIDSCHAFSAGWDIRRPEVYGEMIAEAAGSVGLERVRCWHLNDSKTECGSRVDRHEHIGRGRIGMAGFRQILGDPRFRGVPMILETPKEADAAGRDMDRVNLRRVRALAARCGR